MDAAYNVSALWADDSANLMDPATWQKLGYPLFATADVPGDFGPGHNSFTVDALGNPVMVFHSRTYGDTSNPGEATDGGLYDPRRHARAATVHWDVDGLPLLDMTATEELDPSFAAVSMQVTVLPEDHLVVNYLLDETGGTVAADSSGNGKDASYVGGPTLKGDAGVTLDGVNDYVDLPDNIVAGLDSVTVSMDVLVSTTQGTPYFIYGIGNPATSASGTGYLMATGNAYRNSITTGNWSGEQNTTSGTNLTRGVWKTLTYTLDDATNTSRIYLDGVQVGQSTTTTAKPSQLGGGVTTSNYIGRSNYAADKLLSGSVRNFRMYDIALDPSAVAALVPSDAARVQRDLLAIDLGDTTNVTGNLTLPTTALNGSTVVWSSGTPATVGANGAVTRPSYSAGDAHVTLTATVTKGAVTDTRQFLVIVKAMADDQSIADAGAEALAVANLDDVRGNLTLPTEIKGLPVTWATSDGAVVATDGIVTRQPTDTDVTLTATVTKGSTTAQRVFTAKVKAAFEMGPLEGYGFAYFTGNSIEGEKIYFAASDGNDALTWDETHGGNPVLSSTYGEKGLRDPFVIRSPEGDTFYLIATDLSIGGGTTWDASQRQGSLYLEIWESHDMVNWSAQRHVKVSPDTAGNTWAPEAYYDESLGAYVVFWASKVYAESDPGHTGSTYNKMLYSTTRDFMTFTEPQLWQDGVSRIDSTVTKVDGTYYRFTKDEGGGGTGCSDIIQESSTTLRAPLASWTFVDGCIGRDAGTGPVEGPSIFKSNPGDVNGNYHYLFVDEYGGRGYIPLRTANIAQPNWQVAPSYDLPASPRHGTVIPVTGAELAALRATIVKAPDVTANANGEVLRYDFQSGSGATVTDVTGNGYDGTIVGDATLAGGELTFTGNDYVKVPDNILAGIEDITVEAQVYLDSSLSGNYFIYGLGNTDGSGAGNGYLFTSGNNYRTKIATGNWTTEQAVDAGSALPRNTWVTLTYTLQGDTATVYLNGVPVKTGTVTIDPTDIGKTFTTANHLGKSNYNADGLFKGKYKEFAIYNRALSPAEVLASVGRTDVLLNITLADDSVLKLDPIVDQDAHTVLFPVTPGTDLTALAPVFGTVAGVTAAPASGTLRNLSSAVPVQLSGASTATWTMSAIEMRSPILPGYYADPNVVAYGDTYYIYATTDGSAGWGGKDFYVWSSKDLVSWTRSADPILTLDGASGNVPWASGNAWAPTIIEREGKF
ncbi:MAG: family 43 glycosylhydrolase, partial [Demequinaceae bacterium]|nr:family 43 glycosylhydrolase [Demequinaceae bacterium]